MTFVGVGSGLQSPVAKLFKHWPYRHRTRVNIDFPNVVPQKARNSFRVLDVGGRLKPKNAFTPYTPYAAWFTGGRVHSNECYL